MDGIILIDKPRDWTSFDVVAKIRSLTGVKRVGHAGTLDPMATGLLVMLLGAATKLSGTLMSGDKEYESELTLGIETDTLDADGKVLSREPVRTPPARENVLEVFRNFTGRIRQVPPMTSALKHKGKRLYELAREGKVVHREPREVVVHELSLLDLAGGEFPRIRFLCRCSKGTYIRSLARDIGERLGSGAHLSGLRRTYSHPFSLADARSLPDVEKLIKSGEIDKILLYPEKIRG